MVESIAQLWEIITRHDSIWIRLAVAALIVLLALLIRNYAARIVFGVVLRLTQKTKTDIDRSIVLSFDGPLRWLIVTIGLYLALNYLNLSPAVMSVVSNLFRSAIIVFITWGFYNLVGGSVLSKLIEKLKVDQSLIDFTATVLRFIIIALSITVIAQEWDYNVGGFVAGLGLGGLAFALAAKDTAANLFGGIVIILDKPFAVGDWILTPSVEGTVEVMNFRTTKVRTFANALVNVPNSVLVNEAVTNWARMKKRRISFHLGVTYTTPRVKLQACVNRIKELLENHSEVHQDLIMVRFDQFNDSSLDIFIYFFTKTTVWTEFLAVKEEINFKIMEILEEEGVSVAFPSRSIYFENELKSYLNQGEFESGSNPADQD